MPGFLRSLSGTRPVIMSKQPFRATEANAPGKTGRLIGSTILSWGVSLLLALGAWMFLLRMGRARFPGDLLVLGTLLGLVALCLERALAPIHLPRGWQYRLPFLLSSGVFILPWELQAVIPGVVIPLWWGIIAILGSFLGGLATTGLNESLWENNSPPSVSIQEEVYQRHRQVIGVPGKSRIAKRSFDLCLAFAGLVFSSPVWLVGSFFLWIEDPGPILFVKNSVGKGGINFHQYKFRSMVMGAEESTGPVLARESDERVLLAGRFLRKTALDELPQLVNILRGEMSFVGPRPQRTVLVRTYLEALPEYAERHRVLPGLAGLAQVAGDYYLTPHQKLRFDRLYIRYMSLGFDIKLIALAFSIAFWFRWRPGWNGHLPRRLIRFGSSWGRKPGQR